MDFIQNEWVLQGAAQWSIYHWAHRAHTQEPPRILEIRVPQATVWKSYEVLSTSSLLFELSSNLFKQGYFCWWQGARIVFLDCIKVHIFLQACLLFMCSQSTRHKDIGCIAPCWGTDQFYPCTSVYNVKCAIAMHSPFKETLLYTLA